jgi:replication factor C small subunit
MLEQGLSGIDLIKQIQKQALDLNIPDHKKLALIKECGDVEFRLVEGSDQFVQIESLLAYLALLHEKD